MRRSWLRAIKEFVRHALISSLGLLLFAIEAVYGSVINLLVGHVITSKFVLRVLTALEYTVVVCSALLVAQMMAEDVLHKLKRLLK